MIIIGGESAGGHLASLMASTANDVRYQAGFEDVDTTVQGLIDLYGAHDWLDENHSWTKRDGVLSYVP
jgi:acetyl esterase/lipase